MKRPYTLTIRRPGTLLDTVAEFPVTQDELEALAASFADLLVDRVETETDTEGYDELQRALDSIHATTV